MERDSFDLFLDKVAREIDLPGEKSKEGSKDIAEQTCATCYEIVSHGSRHCPNCGALQKLPEGVHGGFKPRTIMKRRLSVTLLGMETGVELGGNNFTKVHLKIRNLSPVRANVSLTYVDSVLIDVTGRQLSPLDLDEFPDEVAEPLFPTWFYIYPEAYREGVLIFRESPLPLQKAIICAMHQENEDELFTFELEGLPEI
ncbi:MAG TPA: hypothetical protein VGB30_05955 [bacterium]